MTDHAYLDMSKRASVEHMASIAMRYMWSAMLGGRVSLMNMEKVNGSKGGNSGFSKFTDLSC